MCMYAAITYTDQSILGIDTSVNEVKMLLACKHVLN